MSTDPMREARGTCRGAHMDYQAGYTLHHKTDLCVDWVEWRPALALPETPPTHAFEETAIVWSEPDAHGFRRGRCGQCGATWSFIRGDAYRDSITIRHRCGDQYPLPAPAPEETTHPWPTPAPLSRDYAERLVDRLTKSREAMDYAYARAEIVGYLTQTAWISPGKAETNAPAAPEETTLRARVRELEAALRGLRLGAPCIDGTDCWCAIANMPEWDENRGEYVHEDQCREALRALASRPAPSEPAAGACPDCAGFTGQWGQCETCGRQPGLEAKCARLQAALAASGAPEVEGIRETIEELAKLEAAQLADQDEELARLRAEVAALTQRLAEAERETDRVRRDGQAQHEHIVDRYRSALAASEQARQEAERQRDAARAEGERLRGALRDAHEAMVTWFSSEYAEHPIAKRVARALSGPSATTGGPCPLGEACPDAHGYGEIHPAPPHPLADTLAELMAAAQQAQPLPQEMRFTHCEGDSFRVTVQCIGRHTPAPPTGAPTTTNSSNDKE